jgi:hypothetical protein
VTAPLSIAQDVLVTQVTQRIISLASAAGLNPSLCRPARHGTWTVIVDSGGRRDCLFGGIAIGARTGRVLHAHLTHGNWGEERRYDTVAEIRATIMSWAALQRAGQDLEVAR